MASTLELSTATLVFTLDLIGTFVFALSGATSGVKNRLELTFFRNGSGIIRRKKKW